MKTVKPSRKKSFIFIALILAIILLVAGVFIFYRYQSGNLSFGSTPEAGSAAENEELILAVGKLIKLPSETPDIATVSDVTLLQDQTIFRNAQNGDKVLIFTGAKRAIVYRPGENIIIDVGNIVVSAEGSASATLNEEAQDEVTVTIYNATTTAGYAGRIGDDLESKFSNIQVIDTSNAAGDYETVLVVDLIGGNEEIVSALAEELGGEAGDLPDGEEKPDSDILIILGQ